MVKNGIDRIGDYSRLIQGNRLGMVTCAAATAGDLRPSYLVFHERYPLECLFSPEHGLRGSFGNWEDVQEEPVDPETGAALVSLFAKGSARSIPDHWLDRLDAVVYDIQDLGTRFYTYISTMLRVMADCAGAGKPFIILDRPALLGGEVVEGCLLPEALRSFIGPYSLPIRYGLTVGELAAMVNEEQKLNCQLHVIPCEGWRRQQMFPDFGDTWVRPSGAIRDFETALLYPGMGLLEGTSLSEGRGTDRPFRLVGAPSIDGARLSREMNGLGLPGVRFASAEFCPGSSKYMGERCGGVSLTVTDRNAFRSVRTGVSLLYKIQELYPGMVTLRPGRWSPRPHISFLSGSDAWEGELPPLEALLADWDRDCEAFRERKKQYHIYP